MKRSSVPLAAASGVLAVGLLACNLSEVGSAVSGPAAVQIDADSASTSGSSTMPSGGCGNDYAMPISGATWSYQSTGASTGSYSYTTTFEQVTDSGFVEQDAYVSLTRTLDWACKNGSLTMLDLSPDAAHLAAANLMLKTWVVGATGTFLPPAISAGDRWAETLNMKGTMSLARAGNQAVQDSIRTNCAAQPGEHVTVLAGTFSAVKFDCKSSVTVTMQMMARSIPISFDSTYWYVQGVGRVKSITTINGQTVETTLTSYHIP